LREKKKRKKKKTKKKKREKEEEKERSNLRGAAWLPAIRVRLRTKDRINLINIFFGISFEIFVKHSSPRLARRAKYVSSRQKRRRNRSSCSKQKRRLGDVIAA